jgi:hypothetical protein
MRRLPPHTDRLGRLARSLGLDRNPLRRWTDRVETAITTALIAAAVIGAPILAFEVGHRAETTGNQALQAQRSWHRVSAVLLARTPSDTSVTYQSSAIIWVRARWTARDGSVHIGEVPAPAGMQAGRTVRVWVDRSWTAAAIPLTRAQVADRVVAVTVFAPFALAVGLLTVGALAHQLIERRRFASWEAAWTSIEPQWSSRE